MSQRIDILRYVSLTEWVELAVLAVGVAVIAVLAVVAMRARRRGRLRAMLAPRRSPANRLEPAIALIPIATYLALSWPLGLSLKLALPEPWLNVSVQVLTNVAVVAASIAVARWAFAGGLTAWGLRGDRLAADLLWAPVAVLAVWPVCYDLGWLGEFIARQLEWPAPTHQVIDELHDPAAPPGRTALLWLGAVVTAPLAEEMLFRGIILRTIEYVTRKTWPAILISGLLFGLVHASQPQFVAALSALGIVLGWAYARTGSLTLVILIHALFNLRTLVMQSL